MNTPLTESPPRLKDVTEDPWYANWDNVLALGRWLVDEHGFNGPQLLGYFAKSWNWTTEWNEYQEAQRAGS